MFLEGEITLSKQTFRYFTFEIVEIILSINQRKGINNWAVVMTQNRDRLSNVRCDDYYNK